MLTQTKPWYRSATIWSIVISTVAFIASKFIGIQADDIPVPPNPNVDQLKTIANEVVASKENIGSIITTILGSVGAVSAIYNRVSASAKIADPKVPAVE